MKHIIISSIHIKAEQYCIDNNIPLEEALILMFAADLNFFIALNKDRENVIHIHDLINNLSYKINNVERINGTQVKEINCEY